MEALKNIGGVSYIHDYNSLDDLNIRKYQLRFVSDSSQDASLSVLSGSKRTYEVSGMKDEVDEEESEDSQADHEEVDVIDDV